jgi:signal transduction histidine kinase
LLELRRALHRAWDEYRALPTFPGEAEHWPRVMAGLVSVDDAVTRAAATVSAGDPARTARAERDLHAAADRLDEELAGMIVFDRDQGLLAAQRIDRLARWTTVVSALAGAASVALTIVAAVMAIRIVRRFEDSLRDRALELDAFAGRVAHDVKSPLATAGAAVELAQRETTMTERGRASLDRARRAVARVHRLVDDLLGFARAGAVPSPDASADVREVLDDVIGELHPLADEHGVELRVEAVPGDAAVTVAPGILTSILSNLVRNAIQHMGSSTVRQIRVRSRGAERDDALRIEVVDTGPGVAEALVGSIFEPFVRGPEARHPGSGLGLATARRLVVASGGEIGVESVPGSGATFWVELPRRKPATRSGSR